MTPWTDVFRLLVVSVDPLVQRVRVGVDNYVQNLMA